MQRRDKTTESREQRKKRESFISIKVSAIHHRKGAHNYVLSEWCMKKLIKSSDTLFNSSMKRREKGRGRRGVYGDGREGTYTHICLGVEYLHEVAVHLIPIEVGIVAAAVGVVHPQGLLPYVLENPRLVRHNA